MKRGRHPLSDNARRGFALIVTLTLMILLTVIAVGLLSLSSISIRSSGSQNAMNIARGNARMALMIAIGQLQKATGPDQRVTATADLAGAAGGDRLAAGQNPVNLAGLNQGSAVLPGTRYWTGVWKNTRPVPTLANIYSQTQSSTFVQWLISGNEQETESALAAPSLKPSDGNCQVGSDGTASDPKKAVVLVGKHSVGDPSSASLDNYVAVPLVGISRNNNVNGRYGWWIGDEGVKAKINRSSSYSGTSPATYADLSAQRAGWEAVAGFSNFPVPGNAGNGMLANMVTLPQAALIDPSVAAGGGETPLDRAFHSATTDSMGVIVDTMQGGLRLDLTAYLDGGLPAAGTTVAGVVNSPATNKNIIPAGTWVNATMKGPKWDRLKAFNDLAKNLSGGKLLTKEAANVNEVAIAPVIIDLRLLMGAKLFPNGNQCTIKACAKVSVALANPYPYPLQWSQSLDLEILNSFLNTPPTVSSGDDLCRIWGASGTATFVPKNASEAAVFNKTIFRIPPGTLQPGEALAYTNSGAVTTMGTGAVAPMGPFNSDPTNFDNAVLLENTGKNTLPFNIDVRERTCTTQIDVELRHQGASAGRVLRKIEKFELDNNLYYQTQRRFGLTAAPAVGTDPETLKVTDYTKAVPLQLYSFQMSEPGVDYRHRFASAADYGLRSSTLRTYADFNWQATHYRKTLISYNPPPFFMAMSNDRASFQTTAPGGRTGPAFSQNLTGTPLRWGRSDASGSQRTVLFSPPRQLISLAQFQHADLTADNYYASVAHQPGNAVGNSYASPFVSRNLVRHQGRQDFTVTSFNSATPVATDYYDISYLLNTALWDTYFLSTIPRSGSTVPLNKQMVDTHPSGNSSELLDAKLAASRLLINGSFNVNSTNRDAWIALLASSRNLKHPAETGGSTDAMFPRSLEQISGSATPPTGDADDSFSGYRRLTDSELGSLADEIVRQVRVRGPFLSLAHFINRTLVPMTTTASKELGRSGPLQCAIDASGATISPDAAKKAFTDVETADDKLNLGLGGIHADLSGTVSSSFPSPYPNQSKDANPGAVAGILADPAMMTTARPEQGFRSTGIPGWLTQADVLQVIGPSLSARSDTFRIRAYGEAVDSTGHTTAKAWCEAVVQRTPDYLSGSDKPEARATDLHDPLNVTFGRRYEIVSVKWLSPEEI